MEDGALRAPECTRCKSQRAWKHAARGAEEACIWHGRPVAFTGVACRNPLWLDKERRKMTCMIECSDSDRSLGSRYSLHPWLPARGRVEHVNPSPPKPSARSHRRCTCFMPSPYHGHHDCPACLLSNHAYLGPLRTETANIAQGAYRTAPPSPPFTWRPRC